MSALPLRTSLTLTSFFVSLNPVSLISRSKVGCVQYLSIRPRYFKLIIRLRQEIKSSISSPHNFLSQNKQAHQASHKSAQNLSLFLLGCASSRNPKGIHATYSSNLYNIANS